MAAGVVPAAADFLGHEVWGVGGGPEAFADVFADVVDGAVHLSVQFDGGREAPAPGREVIHGVGPSGLQGLSMGVRAHFDRGLAAWDGHGAGIDGFEGVVEEPVGVDCAVLVVFEHENIREALPSDSISQPMAQMPPDVGDGVAVDALWGEGEGDEELPGVGAGDIADGLFGAGDGASDARGPALGLALFLVVGVIFEEDSVAFALGVAAFFEFVMVERKHRDEEWFILEETRQVSSSPAEWLRADKDFSGAVWEVFDFAVMEEGVSRWHRPGETQ